jgi:hypothetical protein
MDYPRTVAFAEKLNQIARFSRAPTAEHNEEGALFEGASRPPLWAIHRLLRPGAHLFRCGNFAVCTVAFVSASLPAPCARPFCVNRTRIVAGCAFG